MKKYLYFLLTLCLSGMLLVGCNLPKPEPDDPTEETENPKAGDDGYWCWKVTTTIPMEGTDDYVTVVGDGRGDGFLCRNHERSLQSNRW